MWNDTHSSSGTTMETRPRARESIRAKIQQWAGEWMGERRNKPIVNGRWRLVLAGTRMHACNFFDRSYLCGACACTREGFHVAETSLFLHTFLISVFISIVQPVGCTGCVRTNPACKYIASAMSRVIDEQAGDGVKGERQQQSRRAVVFRHA